MSINKKSINTEITDAEICNREYLFKHHSYDKEMLQYIYLRDGNDNCIDISKELFNSYEVGNLSDDPIRDKKYLFVASITLATRFSIEGGLPAEEAYNISDVFIRRVDKCDNLDDIFTLHTEMFTYFFKAVQTKQKEQTFSKAVIKSIEYIDTHLHEKISLEILAKEVSLAPSYLSALFKDEYGISLTDYIIRKKIESAENMLLYSNYSVSEISSYLAFSSDSHFINSFKKYKDLTPKKYRDKNYYKSFSNTK